MGKFGKTLEPCQEGGALVGFLPGRMNFQPKNLRVAYSVPAIWESKAWFLRVPRWNPAHAGVNLFIHLSSFETNIVIPERVITCYISLNWNYIYKYIYIRK